MQPPWACVCGPYCMEVPFPELKLNHRSLLTITLNKAPVLGKHLRYDLHGGPIPSTCSLLCSPKSCNCPGRVSQVVNAWRFLFSELELTARSLFTFPISQATVQGMCLRYLLHGGAIPGVLPSSTHRHNTRRSRTMARYGTREHRPGSGAPEEATTHGHQRRPPHHMVLVHRY